MTISAAAVSGGDSVRPDERVEALFEHAGIGMVLVDGAGLCLSVNAEARRMCRVTDSGAAVPVATFVHPDDVAATRQMLAEVVAGLRHRRQIEIRPAAADSVARVWRVTASAVPGQDPKVLLLIEDDTQRRELEEQLQQSQKLEALGALAGGIAHDFNNLLTAIAGYTALMRADLPRESPSLRDLAEIERATESATALTRQLLSFGRRALVRPQVLDVGASLARMEGMLRRLIGEQVRLVIAPAPDTGCIQIDSSQLDQVVINLAVNARDAMPGGGTITIGTAPAVVDDAMAHQHGGRGGDAYVQLTVTDTGCGISAAVRPRIFDPFFTTKSAGRGTGLGLATVYGIVRDAGGFLVVTSEGGQGATFDVYLPRTDLPAVPLVPARAHAPAAPGGRETLLLVEDDENIFKLLQVAMQKRGYTVLAAQTGEDAVQIADMHPEPIALLVTDVVLPGMGGAALASALRRTRPSLRVLYASGYPASAMGLQLQPPQVDFVQKPYSMDIVARKVRSMLDAANSAAC